MIDALPPLDRRRVLGLLASLPVLGWAGRSHAAPPGTASNPAMAPVPATPFPDDIVVMVAGQDGANMERWSRILLPSLTQALPPGTKIRLALAGAADGVTCANQFEARTAPDGTSLMLVPGAAPLSWLVGDTRAQFDPGHWVPVLAGMTPAVVAMRGGAAALEPGRRLRVAVSSPAGPELAALLALDMLGAQPVAVPEPTDDAAVRAALAKGSIDTVLLHGRNVPERARALAALGAPAAFTLGTLDDTGARVRDPAFPNLPHFAELHSTLRSTPPRGPLYDAWRAVAAATQLEFALVLPQLTPAAMVALWRHAAIEAAGALDLQQAATAQSVRALGNSIGTANVSAVTAETSALLELRRWLAARFDWRPS
jgi:hypothetical protein